VALGRSLTAPRSARVSDLAAAARAGTVIGDGSVTVTGLTFDSRAVQPGDLFAALPGSDFDGHRYIPAAVERGAAAVLAEQQIESEVPVILVDDSRAALASISTAFYGDPSRELTMIGLTGTDGKTTTSFLVRDLLQAGGYQTGLIGTVGISIGDGTEYHLPHQTTPESNLVQGYLREMVERGTRAAILEATSHGLHMHRLNGTHFSIAGVTNITREHLEYHKTLENYRRAKAILIERVAASNGVVVLNADDDGSRSMESWTQGASVVWYGTKSSRTELFATNIVVSNTGSRFDLHAEGKIWPVSLPLLGDFNVANALCAIGVARAAGMVIPAIVEVLAGASGVPGRLNPLNQGQPFSVVVDYAHTPESLGKVLRLLRGLHPHGRLIVVSGSAGERDPGKRPLQGAVTARFGDISIVTSEDPRNEDPETIIHEIAKGARDQGATDGETLFEITGRREAIRHAMAIARAGDCVLLAGKGHETSIIWGFEHRPWDEAGVAREELARLGFLSPEEVRT
jgi:UDP-N-acetylmuramoyl-L-alanyl-D-glutamate--2,6-diaminopimelate ligase